MNFFLIGIHSAKAEQPIQGKELQENEDKDEKQYWVKSVRIRSYSGPHCPTFGLKNSEQGHFTQWTFPICIQIG